MPTTNDKTKPALSAGESVEETRDETLGSEVPTAKEQARRRAAIEAMLAFRDSGAIKPVTLEEILAWRDEGHRC
ncbi:MAG: hypothetical protein WBS22_01980 [Methylocystis sp.]